MEFAALVLGVLGAAFVMFALWLVNVLRLAAAYQPVRRHAARPAGRAACACDRQWTGQVVGPPVPGCPVHGETLTRAGE